MTKEKKTQQLQHLQRLHPPVWADILQYFRERFMEEPDRDTIIMSTAVLISNMKKRFDGKYDPEAIAKLLLNGFAAEHKKYIFKRTDFIPRPARHIEQP